MYDQGYRYDLHLRSRGSYIAVGIWCLMSVVLANAYGGVLFSFLSVTKLEPAINSLNELAVSKNVQLLALNGFELTNRLLVQSHDIYSNMFNYKLYLNV